MICVCNAPNNPGMNLFLLIYPLIQLLAINDHVEPLSPQHSPPAGPHWDHLTSPTLRCQHSESSSDLSLWLNTSPLYPETPISSTMSHKDPSKPLSSEDLVRLLLDSCDLKIRENVIYERELTNDKIKLLINDYNKRFDTMTDDFSRNDTVQHEIIADLNLKMKSSAVYHEQLIFNLKTGLQDALLLIEKDMHLVWNKMQAQQESSYSSSPSAHHGLSPQQQQHYHLLCLGQPQHPETPHGRFYPTGDSVENFSLESPVSVSALSAQDMSDIEQIDVNVTIVDLGADLRPPAPSLPPVTLRSAPYTLNIDKQMSRLAKNASISDFSIETTGPDNVNIQCSAGFYQLVAKPILSSLLVPNLSVSGIPISCSDPISPKLDQLRRNVNAVLHFKVGENDRQDSATVHLHHTQQKVQVQGLAAPWFVEHVLQKQFSSGAKDMELSIRNLNAQLSSTATAPKAKNLATFKSCAHCKKQFRMNTKSLSMCGNCCQNFHNTKSSPCFLSHVCSGVSSPASRMVSSSVVTLPISSTITSSSFLTTSVTSLPQTILSSASRSYISSAASRSLVTDPSTTTAVMPSTSGESNSSSSTTLPYTASNHPSLPVLPPGDLSLALDMSQEASSHVMDPEATPFLPPHPEPPPKKRKGKTDAASELMKDPRDVENDFLRRELNIVKVHLLAHETEVKDLKRKNKILSETVEIFENKQQSDMAGSYATAESRPPPPVPSAPPPGQSPAPAPARCCCSGSSPLPSQSSQFLLDSSLANKLLNLLSDLLLKQTGETFAIPCTKSKTATKPQDLPEAPTPSPPEMPARPPTSSATPTSPMSESFNSARNSINTLDEFAADLSQDSFSASLQQAQDENYLNQHVPTTQSTLGHL